MCVKELRRGVDGRSCACRGMCEADARGRVCERVAGRSGAYVDQLKISGLGGQVVLVCDPLALVPALQLACFASVYVSLQCGFGVMHRSRSDVSVWRRRLQEPQCG